MHPIKLGLLGVWIVCLGAFFVGGDASAARLGRLVFWVMAAAHVVEFLVFRGMFQRAGGSLGQHFFQTLVFGFAHIREVREQTSEPAQ